MGYGKPFISFINDVYLSKPSAINPSNVNIVPKTSPPENLLRSADNIPFGSLLNQAARKVNKKVIIPIAERRLYPEFTAEDIDVLFTI